MVAQNTVRTYGVNQGFRVVKVTSKESSNPIFLEKTFFTLYVGNMFWATILYKYYGNYCKQTNLLAPGTDRKIARKLTINNP